ncbi:MAG: hypothetical protein R3254_09340 [Thiomicrorhabdus sp.]|nr:hypothetical protein [Thiomicrorhabdus sp.]
MRDLKPEIISCVPICDYTALEIYKNTRFRKSFYDVWFLQGEEDDPSQVYVAEEELDKWIEALNKAKMIIKKSRDEIKNPDIAK